MDVTGIIFVIGGLAITACFLFLVYELRNEKRENETLQKTLRLKREVLTEVQALAKLGSWDMEISTLKTTWSKEVYRIFEIDENKTGLELYELYAQRLHPDDRVTLDALTLQARDHGKGFEFNHRIYLDDGARVKHVRGIAKVELDKMGRPSVIRGTCQDMTEIKNREAEVQMSLDTLGIGVWRFSPSNQEMIWDDSMYRLFEMDKGEPHDYTAWYSLLTPESKKIADLEVVEMAEGKSEFTSSFEIITRSGKRKHIGRIGRVVRNHQGQPIMFYGVNWDRTKEFESELKITQQSRLMESVLSLIPDMVFVKDYKNELRYTLLNRAGEEIFGASAADIIGKNDHDFFPKAQADFFNQKDMEVFATRASLKIVREEIRTPKGTRQLNTFKVPVFDQNGEPSLIVGVSTDVTDEIEMQRQLESERARSLHNAKLASLGEMCAGIAHEINNPLAIIDGNLQILDLLKGDPTKFSAKVEALRKSVKRISRIVNGLKKFARESDGAEYSEASLAAIIDEVTTLTEAKSKKFMVKTTVDVKADAKIFCDVVEIEQVMINLINNGIDAAKETPGKWLNIITFREGQVAVVQVIDSGSGITPEVEAKIFQPFFTTKKVGEGTGLGLSITKGILDQHQASISVNRTLAHTCFEIRFKIAEEVNRAA